MAQTQFSGIIRQVGEMQSITTASGALFNKRDVVIATQEQYPETIVVELSKDNAVQFAGVPGQMIMVSIDFHATEHNGRWYNNIRCWRYTLGALLGGGLSQSEIVLQKAPTLSPPETLRWFPSGAPDESFAAPITQTGSAAPPPAGTALTPTISLNQPPF